MFDRSGHVLSNPAAEPAANAFESDPNLNFEKWGEYWRKVHGPRFIHADSATDPSLDLLLRYDQIHRLSAAPSRLALLPYLAPVDSDGKLFQTVFDHIEPYRRPDWDGVAYLTFASLNDLTTVLGTERVRTKIAPEDHTIFRDLAPLVARQHVILPSAARHDAVFLVKTHVRHPSLNPGEFQDRWLSDHANLVTTQPDTAHLVRRYVQLHAIDGDASTHSGARDLDGVTVMSFGSMVDLEDYLSSGSFEAIGNAEQGLMDRTRGDYWSGINLTVLDRLGRD